VTLGGLILYRETLPAMVGIRPRTGHPPCRVRGRDMGQATERPEAYCHEVPQPGDILDAFFIAPDCCFRIVWSLELRGSHCEHPAVGKGLFTVKDRTYMVWACEEHVGDLEEVRRVP
jgi:hypothetical protein